MLKHEVMAADEWHNNGPQDLVTIIAIDKMQLCSLSVAYACPYRNPTATMGHSVHNVNISNPLAHTPPSARYSWNRDSSVKSILLQHASGHRRWAFAPWSRLQRQTAVKLRPWWGQRARRWTSLRRYLTVCAENLWLCKTTVSSAVWVAGLRWSCRWRTRAAVTTRGLQFWGRLDILPNSLKRR